MFKLFGNFIFVVDVFEVYDLLVVRYVFVVVYYCFSFDLSELFFMEVEVVFGCIDMF